MRGVLRSLKRTVEMTIEASASCLLFYSVPAHLTVCEQAKSACLLTEEFNFVTDRRQHIGEQIG